MALENSFEDDLAQLRAEFTVEREQVVKQHTKERSELLDIMATVESDEAEKEQETRHVRERGCGSRCRRVCSGLTGVRGWMIVFHHAGV